MLGPLTGEYAGPSRTLNKVWACYYAVCLAFVHVSEQVKPEESALPQLNIPYLKNTYQRFLLKASELFAEFSFLTLTRNSQISLYFTTVLRQNFVLTLCYLMANLAAVLERMLVSLDDATFMPLVH